MTTKRATTLSPTARMATRPRARRLARPVGRRKRIKTLLALLLLLVEAVLALCLVSLVVVLWKFSPEMKSMEGVISDIKTPVPTTIWSQDGVLLGKLEVENRQPVMLSEVPKNLINATVAIEDHRFYEHPGVDVQGIARAVWTNASSGHSLRQGGSTLTQQLVRNLNQFGLSKEKKYSRKIREALTAIRVEQLYSKNEILRLYLNNIYYGAGAIGVQAASRTYFGKSAYKLSLSEAALLAGMPQRPNFTPFTHRTAALKRRDEVLGRMLEYGYITQPEYEKALAEKPRLMPRRTRKNFDFKAPYFVTYILNSLYEKYGADFVYSSGLKIETTLNWKMQQAAEEALLNGLDNASGRQANQGALVSLDPHTGYIRAMVGGRSFLADQYNAVTQGRRQPGSTFKLFDYSAAFDTDTYSLHSSISDADFAYVGDRKGRVVAGSGKSMDIKSAIKWSRNAVAVRVADEIGIKTIIEYAQRMGITTELAPYLPTALGASAVRPLDLCSAYSILPNRGDRCEPMGLVRVSDSDGIVLEEHSPEVKTHILKQSTVDQVDEALEAVVNGGTGAKARGTEETGLIEKARGKTGTTNENRDVWFAGYTPELTTVIWVASVHRDNKGRKHYNEMPGAFGGIVCAPIWHQFMTKAILEQRKFKPITPINVADAKDKSDDEQKPDSEQEKKKKEEARKAAEKKAEKKAVLAEAATTADPAANLSPLNGENTDASPDATSRSKPPEDVEPTTTENPGTQLRVSTPTTSLNPTPTPRKAPPTPEMVTVHLCVDSGEKATDYCTAYKTQKMTLVQARRLRRCREHRPPPGEE